MWRSRQFRLLLNLIDHLPSDTYFAQAVANDPDHARMLVEAQTAVGAEQEPYAPPMSVWTQECELLARNNDLAQQLLHALIAANSREGAAQPKFKPEARPRTMLDKARAQSKRARHQALVARVLPNQQ